MIKSTTWKYCSIAFIWMVIPGSFTHGHSGTSLNWQTVQIENAAHYLSFYISFTSSHLKPYYTTGKSWSSSAFKLMFFSFDYFSVCVKVLRWICDVLPRLSRIKECCSNGEIWKWIGVSTLYLVLLVQMSLISMPRTTSLRKWFYTSHLWISRFS